MDDRLRNQLNIEGAVERIDPEREPQGILSIHLKRYDFALQFCKNLHVLDIACGAGYGSAYLAQVAAKVTGVDIDSEAIMYAKQHYNFNNVTFQIGDATNTGFANGQFDTICSFETIEHLSDIPNYLQEMTRILNSKGTYIVSTPQVAQTNSNPSNPYHTIEYSRSDFQKLLNQYFNHVDIYGQRRKQSNIHYWITQFLDHTGLRKRIPRLGSLRDSVNKAMKTNTFDLMSLEDIIISQEHVERASEIVAVCKDPK